MTMLDVPLLLHLSLISIAAMVAAIFLIAWAAFGKPRHALVWAAAFAVATLCWGVGLVQGGRNDPAGDAVALILEGLAVTLIALGFRRRSGRFMRNRWLITVACFQGLATVVLCFGAVPIPLRAAPLALLGMGMFRLAAQALTGRRRGERTAERLAATVLNVLALGSAGALAMLIAAAAGFTGGIARLDAAWALLLPALVTGIGLFTIFLMAADLADSTRRLASLDMLSGLLNRRGFEEATEAIVGSMRRSGRVMTLVLIDIDRFKTINDKFGHPAGDRLIRSFANCLRHHAQRRDVLARLGGEEFAIVMADADGATAMAAVETLREAITQWRFPLPEPFTMTASFGVTQLRVDGEGLAPALARADAALYRSKADGRNRATLTA